MPVTGARAGANALSLLSVPLNGQVLQSLSNGPKPLMDLRRATGSPPQTTMRGHLRNLTDLGILVRHRQRGFPGSVDYDLGLAGRDLVTVARILRAWLAQSPEGPIELGTPAAKGTIKALVDGWSSGVIRALAAKPLALTELSSIIPGLSYPSLERRLGAMRLAGLIQRCAGAGRGTPYSLTDWLRRGTAPLAAGARWERRHLPEQTTPIGKIDVEAAFLLTVPLVGISADTSGICRLAVESQSTKGEGRLAGVMVEVDGGRVVSCVSRMEGRAGSWAVGSASAWLAAVLEREVDGLEIGGDSALAMDLIEGLNGLLDGVVAVS
jgi:DNA-binding HxlR family transcriptional regulator